MQAERARGAKPHGDGELRGSQVVSENGQEKVVDLSKASREAASSTSNFSSLTSKVDLAQHLHAGV